MSAPQIRSRRQLLCAMGLAPLAALRAAHAAESYPVRPVRLMVPSIPGGVHDVVGRFWAEAVRADLGTLVIDNHGGAGGYVGAVDVARARPDGYTLLLGSSSSQVLVPAQISHPRYDPERDFAAVSLFASSLTAIVVHPDLPVHDLRELLAYIRSHPGQIAYGSTGMGSITHMTGELLIRLGGGLDMNHVPYKGLGQGLSDLLSGQLKVLTPNVTPQVLELHRSGKLRMLAVCGTERLGAAPEIPTAAEAGLVGLVVSMFFGIFVPAGTPAGPVERLARATERALAGEGFRRTLTASGFEPMIGFGPQRSERFVREEIARWTPIIRATGARMD